MLSNYACFLVAKGGAVPVVASGTIRCSCAGFKGQLDVQVSCKMADTIPYRSRMVS